MEYIRHKIETDYNDYSGHILERWFRQAYADTGKFNIVTNYWEKGNGGEPGEKNEIDLVAVNTEEREIIIGECKRNPEKFSRKKLEEKAAGILPHHKKWSVSLVGLSLLDI